MNLLSASGFVIATLNLVTERDESSEPVNSQTYGTLKCWENISCTECKEIIHTASCVRRTVLTLR